MNQALPKKRTNYGRKSFACNGPLVWQSISTKLKSLSYTNFKKKAKAYLIGKY